MRYPLTAGPSKADADALVALPKYVRRMPRVRTISRALRIKTDRVYDSAGRATGLVVDAHVSASGATRGETPSMCLVWRGVDIRCIDWHVRREFADGTVVEGWHEHLWDDVRGRKVGRSFKPPPGGDLDLKAMFLAACDHWSITILTHRDRTLRRAETDDEPEPLAPD